MSEILNTGDNLIVFCTCYIEDKQGDVTYGITFQEYLVENIKLNI